MPTIYIIIVNFNLKDAIIDCLQSLASLSTEDMHLETVVVDNASTDGSADAIKAQFPTVQYVQNKDNLGFSGGNNVGMQLALVNKADYVVILNPDVYVDKDFVQELLKGFSTPEVGVTAPKVYFAKGYEFHKDRYAEGELGHVIWYAGGVMDWNNIIGHHRGVDEVDKGQFDEAMEIDFASGNCMMIKREVLEKVGLFNEKYFMYYEDAEFAQRVKKAGFTIRYVPAAKIWHKNALASGGSGNPLQDYFITRNRLLFGMKYASPRTKLALFRESIKNLFSYKTRRLAVMDYYMGKFGKGSYLK